MGMNLQVINQAKEALEYSGILKLPIRKSLWLELGGIEKNSFFATKTDALKKRVKLAVECINKVSNIWNNSRIVDLKFLLKSVNDYLEDNISAEELMNINNNYRKLVEEIAYNGKEEMCGVIGLACCYVANIALYDELIIYNTDNEDDDEDLDSFTWDASYLISLVYSADVSVVENNKKRKEYWKWYLNKIEKLL